MIADSGGIGGLVNMQGQTACPLCPTDSRFSGQASDGSITCLKADGSSITAIQHPCGPGAVCSPQHIATEGCIVISSTYSLAADFPPPPPACSEYSSDGKKCLSIDSGLGFALPTDAGSLVKALMGVVLSLAGAVAIILIMISGYRMMISQGDPENIKTAREQLTAAIIGLLFIIFSLVILQVIGVNILGLPGFK